MLAKENMQELMKNKGATKKATKKFAGTIEKEALTFRNETANRA